MTKMQKMPIEKKDRKKKIVRTLLLCWYTLALLCLVADMVGIGNGIGKYLGYHPLPDNIPGLEVREVTPRMTMLFTVALCFIPSALGLTALYCCRKYEKNKWRNRISNVLSVFFLGNCIPVIPFLLTAFLELAV